MPVPVKHILLIDDDIDDALLFQYALEEVHHDCQLTIAKYEPGERNDLLQFSVPDIIVLDINMPYKSGKEWLEEIRSIRRYDPVPVVILSGHKNPDYINYCLSNGASKYFIKPATLPEIKKMVAEICNVEIAGIASSKVHWR
jgi:DNA-binding response OmpR family regulator